MVSQHDLPVRAAEDPPWISHSSSLLCREYVEVILVDGNLPAPNHLVWSLQSLCVAVLIPPWLIRGNKRRKRNWETFAVAMPTGWSTVETYVIQHEQVGGVTNGRFTVEVRSFLGCKVAMTPTPHVSGMLVDVLDLLLVGTALCQILALDELNTFRGILD